MNYLLGAVKSYGPTAQHSQDCLIFFIQLNHVYKIEIKQNKPSAKFSQMFDWY